MQMKEWLTQQIEEKAAKKEMSAAEKKFFFTYNFYRNYEEQTMAITHMAKTQEQIFKEKQKAMEKAVQEQNLLLVFLEKIIELTRLKKKKNAK